MSREQRWHFHTETFVCALRGHEAPAATVADLDGWAGDLGIDLPDGRRLARCLRCDAWVAGTVPTSPSALSLPPLDQLERPRRGKELRDAIVMRLIAVERGIHSVLFGLLAIALIVLEAKLGGLQHWARTWQERLTSTVTDTGRGPSQGIVNRGLADVLQLRRNQFPVLIATATTYCVIEGVEAVGLWFEKRWAEYLTVIATVGFIPFEVHELTKKVTVVRAGALVVNIAVVIYLVWTKRLFGLRRPRGASHQ